MSPGTLVDQISPYAQVAAALIPFLLALVLRLVLGKNRLTRLMLSLATMWFAVNVLMAPYSASIRQEIVRLSGHFR